MMPINKILGAIKASDRKLLLNALDAEEENIYIEWAPGRFIGVNMKREDFKISEQSGYWAEGTFPSAVPFELAPFRTS